VVRSRLSWVRDDAEFHVLYGYCATVSGTSERRRTIFLSATVVPWDGNSGRPGLCSCWIGGDGKSRPPAVACNSGRIYKITAGKRFDA